MFAFDQMDEDMLLRLAGVEIEMAMVGAGVMDIGLDLQEGVRARRRKLDPPDPAEVARRQSIRAADIAAGRAVGQYACHGDLVEMFGENTIAMLSRGEPRRTKASAENYRLRSESFETSGKRLLSELIAVRQQYHPDLDLADFRDGPNDYTFAVRECVDRVIPPPKISKLVERVVKARRKLSMFKSITPSPKDREEIADYVRYVSWFIDRFDILDAPAAPALERISLHDATEYLRAVQNHLDKSKGLILHYDNELARYYQEQDEAMLFDKTNAIVALVKKDGSRVENIPALVQPKLIVIKDTSVPIEEEDVIERILPSKVTERFHVTDRGYFSANGSFPEHYQVKVTKLAPTSSVVNNNTNNYHLNGQNPRVTHGDDKSINTAVDNSQNQFSSWKQEVSESNADGADKSELVKRIEELERAKDKSQALEVLSKIASVASTSISLLPTLGKIATWVHGLPV